MRDAGYRWLGLAITLGVLFPATAMADLFDDIGFTELTALLGENLPQGTFSVIDQIEASVAPAGQTPIYLADAGSGLFPNTSIVDRTGLNSTVFSGHANSVARRLAGVPDSVLSALAQIDGYEVNDWLNQVLRGGALFPLTGTGQFANHSWVGNDDSIDAEVDWLRRIDWLIAEDDYLQVVGASNRSRTLFAYAMNVVVVKNTSTTTSMDTKALDDVYLPGRTAIHLVAPQSSASGATGVVTAAAVLLNEIAQPMTLKPVTLKAMLLAGADRTTSNSQNGDIVDYGSMPTTNGLDFRYGAGQLNVFNSYDILNGGQQSSIEVGGQGISGAGFDYVEDFGARQQTRIYPFATGLNFRHLDIALVWNLDINSTGSAFNPDPKLYNLALSLYDVSGANEELVAESDSSVDNTENLSLELLPYRQYEIRISHNESESFSWPYALAWRQTASATTTSEVQITLLPPLVSIAMMILICAISLPSLTSRNR